MITMSSSVNRLINVFAHQIADLKVEWRRMNVTVERKPPLSSEEAYQEKQDGKKVNAN
jgi:hypothetical protein